MTFRRFRVVAYVVPALAVLSIARVAFADVKPHGLFGDGMVLQRDTAVPVWGTADEGEEVRVSFNGQQVSTKATDRKWMVKLQPMKAGGPFSMTISGRNQLELRDVLVGEVWVCSGQSNMVQPVVNSENGKQEVANSANPMIRLFSVPYRACEEPASDVAGSWAECKPETVRGFSAVGYFFGRDLQQALNVPVGLIKSCVGGTRAELWMARPVVEGTAGTEDFFESYQKALMAYEASKKRDEEISAERGEILSKASGEGPRPSQERSGRKPQAPRPAGGYYYGMISPLQPYAIRGVIWYQGEANAGSTKRAEAYRHVFPALIRNWRADWGQGDFPFLYVQLAAYRTREGSDWPLLREAQAMTLSLKNTGMAVAIDVGEENNIHPKRKQPVGHRLALAARALVYGEDIPYSGPTYDGMEVKGNKINIGFKHTHGGLVAKGQKLEGFTIAGQDRKFVEANARIAGDRIVVSSPDLPEPVHVRYAWADYPTCNLYNGAGLPAVPFQAPLPAVDRIGTGSGI